MSASTRAMQWPRANSSARVTDGRVPHPSFVLSEIATKGSLWRIESACFHLSGSFWGRCCTYTLGRVTQAYAFRRMSSVLVVCKILSPTAQACTVSGCYIGDDIMQVRGFDPSSQMVSSVASELQRLRRSNRADPPAEWPLSSANKSPTSLPP